jgi:hypothetical protein
MFAEYRNTFDPFSQFHLLHSSNRYLPPFSFLSFILLMRVFPLLTPTFDRALVQLQPDVIIAKLSKVPTSLAALQVQDLHHPLTSPLDTQLDKPKDSAIQLHASSGPFSSASNWFGTIFCSRRRYFITKKKTTGDHANKEEREEIIAQYRGPAWLINRAWRIQAVNARSGWTFSPRTMNVIPRSSLVFQYAKDDNVNGLRELFDERVASPFDCDEYDRTILHVSTHPGLV